MAFYLPPPMAVTDAGQLYNYLYQMAEQLNIALNSLTPENFSEEARAQGIAGTAIEETQKSQYDALKSLIIKTANVVRSEMDTLETELSSTYLAISDFGEYTQAADARIEANSQGVKQLYELSEQLSAQQEHTDTSFENYKISTSQFIHTGLLYYDSSNIPRYGVAVGENLTTIEIDGENVLERKNLYSTFTSDKLSFWQNDVEVAYVSNSKLFVTNIEILGNAIISNWLIDTSTGFAIKWIGGGA